MWIFIETESDIQIFQESMARDLRHPYIPSTTVLGDRPPVIHTPLFLPILIGHLYTSILTNMNYTGVIDRFEIPVGTCVIMNFCPVSCCIAGIVALSIVPSCHAVYILSVYSPYAKCCGDEEGTEKTVVVGLPNGKNIVEKHRQNSRWKELQ